MKLPPGVSEYLSEETVRSRSPACVLVGRDGRVVEAAGALDRYGLGGLTPGQDAQSRAPVLHGLLPLRAGVLILPRVHVGGRAAADIHLVPAGEGDWVILLDASEEAAAWQRIQQIGNELSLERRADRPGSTADLLRALGIAALERVGPERFRLLGPPPPWFERLYGPVDADDTVDAAGLSSFIRNFLEDAERFWARPGTTPLGSGLWVETDTRKFEWNLEATAVMLQGRALLLVAWHPDRYHEAQQLQQRAREGALRHERLVDEEHRKEKVLHHIVHDLKQPLTVIEAVLGTLESASLSEADARMLAMGREQADRLRRQIRGLVEAFRSDLQAMDRVAEDPPEPSDPVAVVAELLRTFGPAFTLKQVTVAGPAPGAAGHALVTADATQLGRVVGNLLENALRFAPAGSTVRVAVTRLDESVEVAVEDEGPGVAPDVAPLLFRAAEFGPLVSGRSGLGLAYCRATVERWNGRIGYAPRTPSGARFWIRLPVAGRSGAGRA